jgi:ABC-2 type transport system ATP-binding protein
MEAFIETHSERRVLVRSPQAGSLRRLLAGLAQVRTEEAEMLVLTGVGAAEVGAVAAAGGIELHELTPGRPSLEEVFMDLTYDSVEYRTTEETIA